MSSEDEPVLSLEDVEVHFSEETALMEAIPQSIKDRFDWNPNPVRAVDGVSLDIGENDVVAVVGESGSGKTTLGKAAIGLQQPTGGSVKYRGYDIWDVKRQQQIDDMQFSDIRRALQIIHQDPSAALNPYKTIMTSLKEPLRLWNADLTHADCRERIHSVFQEVGLTPVEEYETRYPHELSGGEQQRVVLLRAMLLDPDVILADEPVSKLDPSLRVDLMDLMLDLQDRLNTSFVYITHDLRTARYMASHADGKLAIMYLGRIVEVGPYDEVLDDPKHPYTRILKWATLNTHPDRAKENLEQPFPVRAHEPPDSGNIPSGCRFHPRCPKAREVCATESPQMYGTNGEEGHQAACYLEDQDHEYWNTDFLEEGGEIEIPE